MVCNADSSYPPAMAVPAYPADREPRGLAFEACTITRWRGYVTSTFLAVLGDGTPVAESASFRARGADAPPDAGDARSAFDGLCSTLESLGWESAGQQAGPWYAVRFARPVEVMVVAEEPAEAAPRPPAPRPRPQPQLATPKPAAAKPAAPRPAAAAEAGKPSRRIVLVSSVGIAAAVAVGGFLVLTPSGGQASPPAAAAATQTPKAHATRPAQPAPVQKPAAVQKAAPVRKTPLVRVDITAPERASWLEIRRGSAKGPVLFSGDLVPGRHLHLTGKRLWARFGAASNLTIRANGRPVSFIGTYEHVFTAKTK
jgi:hypothetical protein